MTALFADPLHAAFATMAQAAAVVGAADQAEIQAVAAAVVPGDDESFYRAWREAAESLPEGPETSLRAAVYHGVAWRPFYGPTANERARAGFAAESAAFDRAIALREPGAVRLSIPFEGHDLPGYFLPAHRGSGPRPVLICTNGYDGTLSGLYVHVALAALEHGYHVIVFDGPGQGAMLLEQGVPLRPDWEAVVPPVVDAALAMPEVDPDRIALYGWSLGGYLALRGATGEPRLAACVADPGMPGIRELMVAGLRRSGMSPELAAAFPDLPDELLAGLADEMGKSREGHWRMAQRGPLAHGRASAAEALREAGRLTMAGRYQDLRCPVLLTSAQNDPLAAGARRMAVLVPTPATLMPFTVDEGVGDHCEIRNRPLANARILAWLDDVLGAPAA